MHHDRATRARSFGEIAEEYDRFRPGPPLEAARWVLGEGRARVLDLGAGTGGLTASLVALAHHVLAVEPDARMRAVLARRDLEAAAVGAVGERLPFIGGALDGVVASSSWHWMDSAMAAAEVARVLRPGGVFGLLWSGPDRQIPWVAELLGHPWPADADDSAEHRRRRAMVLPPGLPFSAPEGGVVRFSRSFRPDELAGLSGTYSVVITGGAQERAGRMERVEHRVRSLFGDGPVEVPMLCRCWRTVRTVGATQLG